MVVSGVTPTDPPIITSVALTARTIIIRSLDLNSPWDICKRHTISGDLGLMAFHALSTRAQSS